MQIEFAGAAREVTGSCHIVRANGHTILLDCGLFQGKRQDADAKNRTLPCPIEEIDAVVLSHAHLDHAGRLPFLTNRGYRKPIFATRATADLIAIMLADSARIQENDYAFLIRHGRSVNPPLYELKDASKVEELVQTHLYDQWFDVVKWTLYAMLNAEELGISSKNVEEALKSNQPEIRRLLGVEGNFGEQLGLSKDWVVRIVKQVGNYGEVFERNVGTGSKLGISRGINRLWTKGGIQYAPPVR